VSAVKHVVIAAELLNAGFACVRGSFDPLGRRRYIELAAQLGDLVGEETIAVRPGAHAYVAKPGRVPLHTDHPQVNIIGWLCEEQDDTDGASLVLDTRPLVTSLPDEERELLRQVELICPPLVGGPPTERWPVLQKTRSDDAVFCSPWLRSAKPLKEHEDALERFRLCLSDEAKRALVEIRLMRGDALFVDNRRVLHGRGAIAETSRRRLYRVWIADHARLCRTATSAAVASMSTSRSTGAAS
jgi:hypothetical protein